MFKKIKFQLKNLTMQCRAKALYEHLYEALSKMSLLIFLIDV